MQSRLLDRLNTRIAETSDLILADHLRAELAEALARHGRVPEARELLRVLRGRSHLGRDAALRGRIELADALADYFWDMAASARTKVDHALVQAAQASDRDLEARCEAWRAHLEYVDDRIESAPMKFARALTLARPDAHGARIRASMMIGVMYQFCGRNDLAQPWHAMCRRHASLEGDDASLSSLLYNMAAMRAEQVRRASVFDADGARAGDVAEALAAIESSTALDQRLGGTILEVLRPLTRASILLGQGRYPQALVLYEAYFARAVATGLDRIACSVRADVAWCRLKLKQPEMALEQAVLAETALPVAVNEDDIAITHGRLHKVFAELGEADRADSHGLIARQLWQRHTRRRDAASALLTEHCGHLLEAG